jgi:putative ABC transport system permease protein
MIANLFQDVRYGLRMLRKAPGFTAVAIITLALGIGANAAMFAVFSAFILRPLPYPEPDRLVALWEKRPGMYAGTGERFWFSMADYVALREQSTTLQSTAALVRVRARVTTSTGTTTFKAVKCTANLLDLLGLNVLRGRNFSAAETVEPANHVVLVSSEYALQHFGSVDAALEKTFTLDGAAYRVIGVLPPGFHLPTLDQGEMRIIPQLLYPLDTSTKAASQPGPFVNVIARLKPRVTLQETSSEMQVLAKQMPSRDMKALPPIVGVNVFPLRAEDRSPQARKQLLVFQFAVGFILLIACANVANLLLARATERKREIAIRLALGASRGRIILQLLLESVTLGLMGSAAGLLMGDWLVALITSVAPGDFLQGHQPSIDPRVFGFTLAIAVTASILFGLAPALHTVRQKIHEALSQSGKSVSGQGTRARSIFVVAELSLALTLLVGAGLMIRTLHVLHRVQPGFLPERLLAATVQLPAEKYKIDPKTNDDGKPARFADQLLEKLRALPGVESATIAGSLPMSTIEISTFHLEGQSEQEQRSADVTTVRGDYFKTMGIPIVQGRDFSTQDVAQNAKVMVASQSLARSLWPNQDPIGRRIITGNTGGDYRVIGVSQDTHDLGLDAPATSTAYRIGAIQNLIVIVRSYGDPLQLAKPLTEQVAAIDNDVPVSDIQTVPEIIESSLRDRRFQMWLFVAFAGLAIGLAGIGQYGVLAYTVTTRTREIGIRMALGAQVTDVLRMVVRQGLVLSAAGVVLGLGAALALARLMSSFVFGVKTIDPLTYAFTAATLVLVAICACYIPARRATRVDPMVALRYE